MKQLSTFLRISAIVGLALCLAAALFVIGAHIDSDHDTHDCPVCAMLCVGIGVCLVSAPCAIAGLCLVRQRQTPPTPPVVRRFFVRLN